MSYEVFCKRVNDVVKRNKIGGSVRFSRDEGKHIAECTDGVTIIGNSVSSRVLVKWGSGHTALATI